ncbi:hypothetical protein [Haloarcula laminariae]|uniref:hypothetical protein n=1 Tax=Haloarcula laminariae TaxID=2961577 RepID=UPI0021C5AAE2|nr:hypothetical protein [Halomicroarcula laminariae]
MTAGTETRTVAGVAWPVLAVGLVALGHVGALLAFPSFPPVTTLALLEAMLLVLVVALVAVSDGIGRPALLVVAVYTLCTALTWAWLTVGSTTAATLGVVAVLTVAGYGVHRYELVMLDLVEATDE